MKTIHASIARLHSLALSSSLPLPLPPSLPARPLARSLLTPVSHINPPPPPPSTTPTSVHKGSLRGRMYLDKRKHLAYQVEPRVHRGHGDSLDNQPCPSQNSISAATLQNEHIRHQLLEWGWGGWGLSVKTSFFHFLHGSFILAPGLWSSVFTDEPTCGAGRTSGAKRTFTGPAKNRSATVAQEGGLGFDLPPSTRTVQLRNSFEIQHFFLKADATIQPRSLTRSLAGTSDFDPTICWSGSRMETSNVT